MSENAPTSTSDVPQETPLATDSVEPTESDETAALVEGDLLVEDVSIDGMCGVY
jgi:mycofactocin precursor